MSASPEVRRHTRSRFRSWQALAAASPEQVQRYADPVFAPVAASSSSSSFNGSEEGSRQFARSQSQAQSDLSQEQRASRGFADQPRFSRRSLVSESFVPEAPAPRVPSLLPTSLRLAALA